MQTHIVFDLDWTIADTQKIHQQIESDFIKSQWYVITPESIWIKYAWRSPQERIPELLRSENISFVQSDIDNFVHNKDSIVIDLLQKWEIQLMPYAFEILKYLHNKNYKIWLASWACRTFINQFILYFWFENIIIASTSANEVENKKPHPDVFLNTFKQLEDRYWKSEISYVIWDWRSDMEWWYRAWSETVRLNYLNKTKLNDIYCKYEIQSLKELEDIL